ncbi:MAG: tRNA 2-selenouridine(34) synthase MnmH [Peptococcaceae bacterium]|jgi:tRNA 2-selenouridine synthase|nr:MAG: tRNA 2-selenouridine(34) synthase MnmH [Peptococcaceae bacterium]
MYRDISIAEALAKKDVLLMDVRSEGEFQEATIPGAVNVPLLNNEERAAVGVTYKKDGPGIARRLGLELVAPKLSEKVEALDRLAGSQEIVVFCWRGGLRSQFMASVLDTINYKVSRVIGGYKAYRRYVNEYLGRDKLPHRAIVLYGLTGVGKTEVLLHLAEKGIPVLDLEGLACHRGSVYGKIGLPPSPTQKMFEGNIVQVLMNAQNEGIFMVECESKRIGNLLVPRSVLASMQEGYRILLYSSLADRVRRIREIYTAGPGGNTAELQKATASLEKRLGRTKVEELNRRLAEGDYDGVFSFLLTSYYDPLYKYPDGPSPEYDLSVDSTDVAEAARIIYDFVVNLPDWRRNS